MIMQVDNPVHLWISELFQVSRDGLMENIIKAYKRIYQQDYMQAIASDLKECPTHLKVETFTNDKTLVSGVDLYCVLKLMIENWDRLFQGTKLRKIPDRDYAQRLKDMRNAWAHQRPISHQDALSAAQAAHYLLNKLPDSDRYVQKIGQIAQSIMEHEQKAEAEPQIQNPPPIRAVSLQPDIRPESPDEMPDFQIMNSDGQTERMEALAQAEEFYIQVIQNDSQTRCERVSLQEGRFVIGRGTHSHIQIGDPRVSRAHLLLMPNGNDGLKIIDLRSANGTQLENEILKPNQPTHWTTGASVMIGSTWLILRQGQM